ncbi:MAG: hypothetical protein QM775_27335 [Pirellulales bacterium]
MRVRIDEAGRYDDRAEIDTATFGDARRRADCQDAIATDDDTGVLQRRAVHRDDAVRMVTHDFQRIARQRTAPGHARQ